MSRRPNVAMTLRNSLVRTRGVRVNLAVSLTLGDAIHVAYCPMRIAVVISQSILLANILKWTGAAYLSFIGTKYLSAKRLNSEQTDVV
jgi:threonine/homoserine/homoserine lactone efflux protein